MKRCRAALIAFAAVFGVTAWPGIRPACAQPAIGGNAAASNVATIDAETVWAFRTISPVSVRSTVVRLGDVAEPLDPHMASWQRLKRSPVGLVPVSGKPMTIQRDRLARAVHNAEATPATIRWFGAKTIEVNYRPDAPMSRTTTPRVRDALAGAGTTTTTAIQQVAYVDTRQQLAAENLVPLSAGEAQRIEHWITHALKKQHPGIREQYRTEIDRHQVGMARLRRIAGVVTVEPAGRLQAGDCQFHVVGRSINGPVKSDITIHLVPHPMVPVARRSFPRGHEMAAGDLMLVPIPEDKLDPEFILDAQDAIGLEVHGPIREGKPISHSSLGAPILVRRGDLVEVRAVGQGLTVTTNAKALGEGSESDLIEVETLQPKKRLVARVVAVGTVEIVTRAPRVRP